MPHGLDAEQLEQKKREAARTDARAAAAETQNAIAWLLESQAAPSLQEQTRRHRRALMISASVSIAVVGLGLYPTAIGVLGITLDAPRPQAAVPTGLFLFNAFLFFEFSRAAMNDRKARKQQITLARARVHLAFTRELNDSNEEPERVLHEQEEIKKTLMIDEPSQQLPIADYYRFATDDIIDFWIPVFLGGVGISIAAYGAACSIPPSLWSRILYRLSDTHHVLIA